MNVKYIWKTVNQLPVFPHSNMVKIISVFWAQNAESESGSSSSLPFKTHMHFHLTGFMVVDLPGSGNECLPADENDLFVGEVEALRQERKSWRRRALVKGIIFISFLNGLK